jgi:hypothetical protein
MKIPSLTLVRQELEQPAIADIPGEVQRQWQTSGLSQRFRRGAGVAVAVGSRGIANLAVIVRATVDWLRDQGTQPFIVAAMGSHGGGTLEGQREILASYGITEEALRVPVRTEMTTVEIGKNSWNEPVLWDKNAWEADAVVTISRVKAHTDFRGRTESGIIKMLAIGLGKRDGAAQHHRWGVRGLRDMIPASARVIVEKSRFLGGLAILENSSDQTAVLRAVHRDELFTVEPVLLEQAKALMGRLPFDHLDLLVIGEIGKNYSGAGIDPNVVGRLLMEGEPEFEKPRITRICALDLSPESHGNGTGVGIADLTTNRLLGKIQQTPFRMNNLTSCFLWRSKIPFSFPTDRECIEAGVASCWQPKFDDLRMAIIPNTLELSELWVSPALVEEIKAKPFLKIYGEPQEAPFHSTGFLRQTALFPQCHRARRGESRRS